MMRPRPSDTDTNGSSTRENGICKYCGGAGALVKNSTSGETATWYDGNSEATSVSNVSVKKLPIQSISIAADKTAYTYGEEVKLTAEVSLADGVTATYAWMNADGSEQTLGSTQEITLNDLTPNSDDNKYTIRCTVTVDGYSISEYIEFTVTKATLAESDYTAPTAKTGLTYMKDTDQVLINTGSFGSNVTITGSNAPKFWYGWKNDNDTINWVTSAVTGRDAGEYTVYWYIDGGTNYENVGSAENPAGTLTVPIAPMELTRVSATVKPKTYDGTTKAEVDTITFWAGSNVVALDSEDYKVSAAFTTKDAGSDKAVNCTVTLKNSNYTFVDLGTAQETDTQTFTANDGTISKATLAEPLQGITVYRKAGSSEIQTVAVTPAVVGMPADAGNVHYKQQYVGQEVDCNIDGNTSIVTIRNVYGNTGDSKTFTVEFTSTNYENASVTVTVVLTDKKIPTLTMNADTITKGYDGQPLPASAITGTAADGETPVKGTWSWTGKAPRNVADSGKISVTFTPTNSNDYAPATGTVTVTITPAALTGAPTYVSIDTAGKTLADAALQPNESWPVGEIKWTDGDGDTFADDTAVVQGKSYHWVFEQTSNSNYAEKIEGNIVLWANAPTPSTPSVPTPSTPSGGGGGGQTGNVTGSSQAGNIIGGSQNGKVTESSQAGNMTGIGQNGNASQWKQPAKNGTFGVPEQSSVPYIEGNTKQNGWEKIKDRLEEAKEKTSVTIEMNGTCVVPGKVLDTIKGKDVTVVFDMGGGITWIVNGKDITADTVGDIDFGVTLGSQAGKSIPVEIINKVTGERYSLNLTLSYEGEFGFTATLTLNVDKENAGLFAKLFYYNPASGELEYICADRIDENGNANLKFTHASDYVIVIDTEDMQRAQTSDTTGNGENAENMTEEISADSRPQETAPADSRNTALSTVILIIAVMVLLAGSVWYAVRKKENKKA